LRPRRPTRRELARRQADPCALKRDPKKRAPGDRVDAEVSARA
jgi:hypothetical protein